MITAGDAAEPEAAGEGDGEEQEVAARGEGGRPEQKRKAASLPKRGSKAKSTIRKMTSRGKKEIVDPRQQLFMKNFFQVKDAEESGKLESGDRLNLEAADSAEGAAGGAAEDEHAYAEPG